MFNCITVQQQNCLNLYSKANSNANKCIYSKYRTKPYWHLHEFCSRNGIGLCVVAMRRPTISVAHSVAWSGVHARLRRPFLSACLCVLIQNIIIINSLWHRLSSKCLPSTGTFECSARHCSIDTPTTLCSMLCGKVEELNEDARTDQKMSHYCPTFLSVAAPFM